MGDRISLTPHKQEYWVKKSILRIALFSLWFFILLISGYYILKENEQLKQDTIHYKNIIAEYNVKLDDLTLKIQQAKQMLIPVEKEKIMPENMLLFLNLIENMPTKGGLESVQIIYDRQDQIRVNGHLEESQFLILEDYIKAQSLHFTIENFQTNEKSYVDFSLRIEGHLR